MDETTLNKNSKEPASYKLLKIIGRGGYGIIYDAILNNERVVIKSALKENITEVKFLKRLTNVTGVVQYIKHFYVGPNIFIVMQSVENSLDLYDYLSINNCILPENIVKHILQQLITILLECKAKGVLHNDIKEANILINPLTHTITLIDFNAADEWKSKFLYNNYRGTKYYSCPEWHLYGIYTADEMCSWSIGILMYTMLCGNIPFESSNQIIYGNINNKMEKLMSGNAWTFLHKCLDKNHHSRVKLHNMLQDEWFKND